MDLKELMLKAVETAEIASSAVMRIYNAGNFEVEAKADNSPLTLADKEAHRVISEGLKFSGFPILSEEGKMTPYDERKHWEYFWMVDPVDGTKEFMKRNGEFTVNIALIHKNFPVFGVVAVPVSGEVFYGGGDLGAFVKRGNTIYKLSTRKSANFSDPELRVVASRSHLSDETKAFIDQLKTPTLLSKGSSLKFMLIAEGHADVYPRYAPTMEWDTAAAHAIVNAVGLKVFKIDSETELQYNKENLLNPYFLVK
jgi:3'(2'), 5'-bisphosphate nucleotidase